MIELDFISIDSMPLTCVLPINFIHALLLRTAAPVVVIGLMLWAIGFLGRRAAQMQYRGLVGKANSLHKWADLIFDMIFLLIFIIYPSTTSKIFQAFMCESFDDGTRYLKADYSIDCTSPSYLIMQLYAIVMIFVYPIGTPCLYGYLLYRHRHILLKLRRDEVRAMGLQNERDLRRASIQLGMRKRQAMLSVQVTTKSLLTGEVTKHKAKDALVVLHANCLAVHKSALIPVPEYRLWLSGPKARCTLCKCSGELYLHLQGKQMPDAESNNITVELRISVTKADDDSSVTPAVLVMGWHGAILAEMSDAKWNAESSSFVVSASAGHKKLNMASLVTRASEQNLDKLDDRARAQARVALPVYFKKIIGPCTGVKLKPTLLAKHNSYSPA